MCPSPYKYPSTPELLKNSVRAIVLTGYFNRDLAYWSLILSGRKGREKTRTRGALSSCLTGQLVPYLGSDIVAWQHRFSFLSLGIIILVTWSTSY